MSAVALAPANVAGEVVAYERISKFRVQQHGLDVEVTRNIDRQHKDNEAAAVELGLGAVRHFRDDGLSASQFATKVRGDWEALLRHVRSGAVSHVVVWLLDRASRTTEASEALLAACRAGGALIVQSATNTTVDPHNPDDIFRVKLAGLLAEYEVAKMSVRQRRAKQEAARVGKAHGGRRRFGYEPGMAEVRESEAAVIREAVARVLAGASLNSVAVWLNDGLTRDTLGPIRRPTSEGNRWTGSNVGVMLTRPHLAGLRVHQGKVAGTGLWPAIVSRADHERLVHKLSDPKRRTSYSNARVYLLANLARCAQCGGPLRGRPGTKRNPERRAYACATGRHCYRAVELVDSVVSELIVNRLEWLTEAGVLSLERDDAADELAEAARARDELTERMAELAREFATGTLSASGYGAAVGAVEHEVADVERRLVELRTEAASPVSVLEGMTGAGAGAAWEAADLGRRRAVVDALAVVQLKGAATRRAPFKPSDVVITWKVR